MRRFSACAVSAVVLTFAIAACGGSSGGGGSSDNGISSKSPDQIVSAVNTAVNGVNSVHVAGAVSNGGSKTTLDLNLVNGKGGKGTMSQSGLAFKIVAVGNQVYINGSNAFWQKFGGSAAAQLLSGKWLKAPATGQLSSIASLTNVHTLFNQLLSSHGKLAKGSTTTVHGQKVIAVNDTTNGGTLYVATTGKPYPIQLNKSGSDGGQITFDQFNQAVTLAAPSNSIDISKLQ
ncbi:MAG TPA: hypothetical protein VGF91_20030 [Solirubrobacteraceae bacterium]|jgi:hypothetical protein